MIQRVLLLAAALGALVLASAASAGAQGPALTGAGSTWAQIAIDQWEADAAKLGLSINYQGVGSTAGRQFFIQNQVDFAASEIPFLGSEVGQLRGEHKSYQYLPDVAGGTALMYNVRDSQGRQVRNLQLSATTIAKIFTGKISNWDDPAIRADNPGLHLPNQRLTPVIRADGSGTSAKLADYLLHEAPSIWDPFAAANHLSGPVQFWPQFQGSVAVNLSDGVANFISNSTSGPGSIGYVEAGYVYEHNLVPVYVRNRSGHYAAPTATDDEVALKHVTLNSDLTENLVGAYNAPEANAYPLASYSYLITQTTGFDPAKGAVLGKFIIYIACAGQKEAVPLGYAPLTPNLVRDVFTAEQRIPGAPKPPPLTASGCPNPTITGAGYGGGPPGSGTGTGTQTGSGSGTHTHKTHKTHKHKHHAKPAKGVSTPAASGDPRSASIALLSASDRAAAQRAGRALAAAAAAPSQSALYGAGAGLAALVLLPAALLGRSWRRTASEVKP